MPLSRTGAGQSAAMAHPSVTTPPAAGLAARVSLRAAMQAEATAWAKAPSGALRPHPFGVT